MERKPSFLVTENKYLKILRKLVLVNYIFFFDFVKISLHQNTKITPLEVFVDLLNLNSKLISVPLTSKINTGILLPQAISRRSHRTCSIKKWVLRNFAKFTGKHLCQSIAFNKVAGLRAATLLKKETLAQVRPCEFC